MNTRLVHRFAQPGQARSAPAVRLPTTRLPVVLVVCGLLAGGAQAETPRDFLARFEAEARATAPAFSASPARGEQFFHRAGTKDWRCATCHTDQPTAIGKHATTGKPIDALSPVANAERFVRPDKVDKWFKRNCNDVLERPCSSSEKADLLAYLMTVKK
jgi:hypothetical protein